MKKRVVGALCLVLMNLTLQLSAQEPGLWLEEWLEARESNEDDNSEAVLEELQLLKQPLLPGSIDLNRADWEQLVGSGLFQPHEAAALLAHRARYGPLIAWYELQAVSGFTPERIAQWRPWCVVGPAHQLGSWRYSLQHAAHRLLFRTSGVLQPQEGYSAERRDDGRSHYAGSPVAMRLQYRQQGYRHSMALSAARDPGELGFERVGGHLAGKSTGRLQQWVIGDYHLRLGEGLVANTGFVPGQTAGLAALAHQGTALNGATGLQAFGTYRGLAARWQWHQHWWATTWLFQQRWSARLETQDEAWVVGSIQSSGRYRTPTELARRNNLGVRGGGAQLKYQRQRWQVAAQSQLVQTALPLMGGERLYQVHWPQGRHFFNSSLSHLWQGMRLQQYGEVAVFRNQWAVLQHVQWSVHSRLQTRLSYRHYPPAYHSFFGNALQTGSRLQNESGWLWMSSWQPSRKWHWEHYTDFYRHPWLRFRVNAPSHGLDQRLQLQYSPSRQQQYIVRLRQTEKVLNEPTDRFSVPAGRFQYRLTAMVRQQTEDWQIWLRADRHLLTTSNQSTEAFMLSYRVRYQHLKWRISWQQASFDAPDFDNRFYLSEPDLLYAPGMAMLSGTGVHSILLLQYKARRGLDFWLRYRHTRYSGRSTVGSGLDASAGNLRSELRFQMQYRF